MKANAIWRHCQEDYLQYFAAVFLLVPTLISIIEVVRRYGFGKSFAWQQDVITYSILSGTFLFFCIAQSRGLHLRVTIIPDLLRNRGSRIHLRIATMLEIIVALVGLLFCAFLVLRGVPTAERMLLTNRMADSQIVPLWPFYILFLLGMALMAVSFFFQLLTNIQFLRGKAPEFPDADFGYTTDSIL